MRVFIAGIMQGSRQENDLDSQSYRARITQALITHLPAAEIVDPLALHPNSLSYNDTQVRTTFQDMTRLAGQADLVIAYVPQASMGTAIEMWTAHNAGKPILVVTPLLHNWVVKYCASHILPDLESLLAFIENGSLTRLVDASPPTD
ncbi:MAG: hypothetical protein KC418_13200 [Anaerolineales bacterium]|nr:hypothetical protein [Anaerolineales bacterium]MCB8954446.1 hypothetical protein [Ardenticatenales bacterium]